VTSASRYSERVACLRVNGYPATLYGVLLSNPERSNLLEIPTGTHLRRAIQGPAILSLGRHPVSYIEQFCGGYNTQMRVVPRVVDEVVVGASNATLVQVLEAYRDLAEDVVLRGAILFGEKHNQVYARAILCDMITTGYVRKLFLEFADQKLDFDETAVETYGSYLRGNKHLVGSQDVRWLEWKQSANYASDVYTKNLIPMVFMIEHASRYNVDVYYADMGLKNDKSDLTKAGLTRRNRATADVFLQHSNPREAGSVVLCGQDHLVEGKCEGEFTFQRLFQLPPSQVFYLADV
jgi:hypothetical protein